MDGRLLGRTGLTVPALGLGTVKLGRNRDVKYPQAFDLPDDATVAALLDAALAEGVVLWDTAPAYGIAEERLGPHVAKHRDRLVLCTKVGEDHGPEGSHHDFSARAVVSSLERSLRRLRTDHVDVALIHSDGRDREILERTDVLEGLERARREGKTRAIGISAKTSEGVDHARGCLDVVMAPVNPEAGAVLEALRRAREDGLGILGIKVFGQGHSLGADDAVERALRAALVDGPADCAVVGTRDPGHLREAAEAARKVMAHAGGGAS